MTAYSETMAGVRSLVDLLRLRAQNHPEREGYVFLADQEPEKASLTYGELDRLAQATAGYLQSYDASGERVILLFPPGLEFVRAFFGCLYAGAIAVPTQLPPNRPRQTHGFLRFKAVADDARPLAVLTTSKVAAAAESLQHQIPSLKDALWIPIDSAICAQAPSWREPQINSSSLAFLQYTSGSTAIPKGVEVTHANLLYNSAYINYGFKHSRESVGLTWLPHFHDMGLIDGIIQPLFMGFPGFLMSPLSFLQSPVRWLQAIASYRVTHTGGPNFAYDLCVRRVSAEQKRDLDLSSWSVAYNGAEPVRAGTIQAFSEAFQECGFSVKTFYPAYGMAEATLKITGGERGSGPRFCDVDAAALERHQIVEVARDDPGARRLVGSGTTSMGTEVLIVNPDSKVKCRTDQVGEIWVSGPGVVQGYWGKELDTRETFYACLNDSGEERYLRTGDLGFLRDGELYVTGRLKDLIIIRGLNHYPHDIELTAQRSNSVLRAGGGAAFSIDVSGQERLVIVQEIDARNKVDFNVLVDSIHEAVSEEHEIQAYSIALVKPGTVPKTTSGKIQRRNARELFLKDELDVVHRWQEAAERDAAVEIVEPIIDLLDSAAAVEWLRSVVARRLGTAPSKIETDQPISRFGLDSLEAIELLHQIEDSLGRGLSLSFLLQSPTIAEVAKALTKPQKGSLLHRRIQIEASAEKTGSFPLSAGQHSLWYLNQIAPKSPAYNIVAAVRIASPISLEALRLSFQTIIERHSVLRAVFTVTGGIPVQTVRQNAELSFEWHDAQDWDETLLEQKLAQDANCLFDLEHGPLLRVRLYRRGPGEHIMVLATHHIVTDLWSIAIILKDFGELYASRLGRYCPTVEPVSEPNRIEYEDYVRWQRHILDCPEEESDWSYWENQLSGAPPTINLQTDRARPAVQTLKGASRSFFIEEDTALGFRDACRRCGVTLNMGLLTVFAILLHRYSAQNDILIGTPAAGRSSRGLERLVGYLVNPVVIRAVVDHSFTFEELALRIRHTVAEALEHDFYPFPMVVQRLQPERDPSRSPLCQVFFAFQNNALFNGIDLGPFALGVTGGRMKLGELSLESMGIQRSGAQFDLSVTAAECGSAIGVLIEYCTDLFDRTTIGRLADNFKTLVGSIVNGQQTPMSDLLLIAKREREQVLLEWNDTARRYPQFESLLAMIEERAGSAPDATALVYEGEHLSYAELMNGKSERVSATLMELGVGPEVIVGISIDRSLDLVCGLIGILKAGGAYLPLDPHDPKDRISFMIADSGVDIVLTQSCWAGALQRTGQRLICLDQVEHSNTFHSRDRGISPPTRDNLAYVIYTSGSTGRPKGAMNTNRAIINRLAWMQERYSLDDSDATLQKTPFTFDVSVWEFFWPLIAGSKLVISRPDGHKDPTYLADVLRDEQITTVHFVPSMLRVFVEGAVPRASSSLKRIICSGEELTLDLEQAVFARTNVELHNLYGPTEAAIDVTYWQCTGQTERQRVPIGRPISNTQIHIVDDLMRMIPVGAAGELLIGGAALARGYVGRPDMTAERFIPDPFGISPGSRAYRTGDLARYSSGGELEYLGRIDHQVKIRGFRIELGEIEAALKSHESVSDAVVVARSDDGRQGTSLAAYVVPRKVSDDIGLSVEDVRDHTRSLLPNYMVPSHFVLLESLPLTPSGKVDRRSLPALKNSISAASTEYAPPASELEGALVQIFKEVLSLERVGVNDNFFDLGGHSLIAAQVLSRVRDRFNVEVSLRELFENPTVFGISRLIGCEERCGEPQTAPISRIEQPVEELLQSTLERMSEEEVDALWDNVSGAQSPARR